MKTKGILKIFFSSLLVLVLVCALVFAMRFDGELPSFFGFGANYPDSDSYTVGGGSIQGEILRVELHWISGSVDIRPYDGETVVLTETGATNEDDMLRYRLKDGTLTVQYRKSGFLWRTSTNKSLEILIPNSMAESLTLFMADTASADITVQGLTVTDFSVDSASGNFRADNCVFNSFEADSASGDCILENCTVTAFEMDSASGKGKLSGSVETVNFESASGGLQIDSSVTPRVIEVDTASGKSVIAIPKNSEFTAELDAASGDLYVEVFAGKGGKDLYICGNGSNRYEFDSASGDVHIRAID